MFEIFFTLSHSFPIENWSINCIDHLSFNEVPDKGIRVVPYLDCLVAFISEKNSSIILVSS